MRMKRLNGGKRRLISASERYHAGAAKNRNAAKGFFKNVVSAGSPPRRTPQLKIQWHLTQGREDAMGCIN
jgi:hypothetical protein